MALAMGKWGCWLAVAVHVVVRGKEAMVRVNDHSSDQLPPFHLSNICHAMVTTVTRPE